jgi:hypothetical protein
LPLDFTHLRTVSMVKVFWDVTTSRLVNRDNSKDRCATETSVAIYQ